MQKWKDEQLANLEFSQGIEQSSEASRMLEYGDTNRQLPVRMAQVLQAYYTKVECMVRRYGDDFALGFHIGQELEKFQCTVGNPVSKPQLFIETVAKEFQPNISTASQVEPKKKGLFG